RSQQVFVGGMHNNTGVGCAAKQSIKLFELASLSLPAHPFRLARIPHSSPVKQMKAVLAVSSVQGVNTTLRDGEQSGVSRRLFSLRVWKIAQQSEMDLRILVSEVMNFEFLDELMYLRLDE